MGQGNRLTNDIGLVGELQTRKIRLNTSNVPPTTESGQMVWDEQYETVRLLLSNGSAIPVTVHIGHDVFYYVKADATITRGDVVYASGTEGASGHILCDRFTADGSIESRRILGIAAKDAVAGDFIHVIHFGELSSINTSGFDTGDILFADPSTAGGLTATKPSAPNNIITVAIALNSKSNGTLRVRPTFGSLLSENEEVLITNPQDGDILVYQASTGLWVNQAPA